MSYEESINNLKQSSGVEFYELLENFINFKIPPVIKNILSITLHNSAYAFYNFDETSLNEIETFMRNDFTAEMIENGSSSKDYLGYYCDTQDQFKLICGQIKIINNIARECQKLYETTKKTESIEESNDSSSDDISQSVELLFANVYQWMKSNQKLHKTLEQEMLFKVRKSKTLRKSDGSFSVFMKCPIKECMDGFTVTYKGYRRQNQKTNSSKEVDSKHSVTPRWNYSYLRKHLLTSHGSDEMNNGYIDDSEFSENQSSSTDHHAIESSQNRDRDVLNEAHPNEPHSISDSKSDHTISCEQVPARTVRTTMKLRARDTQPRTSKKKKRNE